MPETPEQESLVHTAQRLAGNIDVLSKRLDAVVKFGERNRRIIRWVMASFVLDVTLTIGVTALSITSVIQSSDLQSASHATCLVANKTRHDEITLWDTVIRLSSANSQHLKETPAQRKKNQEQANAFLRDVKQIFHQFDCTRGIAEGKE